MVIARARSWIGVALGFVIGGLLGLALGPCHAPTVPVATPQQAPGAGGPSGSPPDTAKLRELEAEVAWWRSAYEDLARAQTETEATAETATGSEAAAPARDAGAGDFDGAVLQGIGYTEQEIQLLRERFETYERDLLYLREQARREEWRDEPRYGIGVAMLREELRADLGDQDFDALLYAIGRNNRVVVAGVLTDTAAERAGLRVGDELISYDGRRIFDGQAIVRATAEGVAGRTTELRVRRDGEELRFLLPRGPIGIRLQPALRAPEGLR